VGSGSRLHFRPPTLTTTPHTRRSPSAHTHPFRRLRATVLDAKLSTIIRGLVGVERRRRITATATAILAVRDEFTRRNALGHGRLPVEIEKVCAAELEHRANAWLAISRRALDDSSTRWTAATADALGQLLRTEVRSDWDGLLDTYREAVAPHGHEPTLRFGALDEAQGLTEAEITNELQLLVLGEDRARVPVTDQLMAPRYAAALASWDRATTNARATGDERVQAIRDAVGAVEQLARIVTESPTATLGACVVTLKREKRVAEPLLRGVEEIWGWTSNTPGLRHGASASEQPSSAETEYCLKLAEGALVLLLSLDTP
jgi:hypothetical protein